MPNSFSCIAVSNCLKSVIKLNISFQIMISSLVQGIGAVPAFLQILEAVQTSSGAEAYICHHPQVCTQTCTSVVFTFEILAFRAITRNKSSCFSLPLSSLLGLQGFAFHTETPTELSLNNIIPFCTWHNRSKGKLKFLGILFSYLGSWDRPVPERKLPHNNTFYVHCHS